MNGRTDVEDDPFAVGVSFVRGYYDQLHSDPTGIAKYFASNSSFTHSESDSHFQKASRGQEEIRATISTLGLTDVQTDIKSIDCQSSLHGAVLILVNGFLIPTSQGPRKFVQTFLLGKSGQRDRKSFFVANSCFRYLEDDSEPIVEADAEEETEEAAEEWPEEETIEQEPIPDMEEAVVEPEPEEVTPEPIEEEEVAEEPAPAEPAAPEVIETPPVQSTPTNYAEALLQNKAPQKVQRTMAPAPAGPVVAAPAAPTPARTGPARGERQTSGAGRGGRGGRSFEPRQEHPAVFVAQLPPDTSEDELKTAFGKFGEIHAIRNRPQKKIAFIDFTTVAGQTGSIEAARNNLINIRGSTVAVQKRDNSSHEGEGRGRGKGRGAATTSQSWSGSGGYSFEGDHAEIQTGADRGTGRSGRRGGASPHRGRGRGRNSEWSGSRGFGTGRNEHE
eukprot:TRINITY_DN10444_c1_g1_i4.p1 TRINITY_DN10444_c1_g1~~TRINITY_DN10444_c1_g1_i4.p1  ORF type:complete len:446 (+),score=99.41 TRINITY_DN10444_c1_g1_i4:69-1406(+)